MKRLLWALLIAALAATGGCDKKKAPNNTPAPKTASVAQTNEAMHTVAAASPASDPSLPEASTAMAALDAASSPTTVR